MIPDVDLAIRSRQLTTSALAAQALLFCPLSSTWLRQPCSQNDSAIKAIGWHGLNCLIARDVPHFWMESETRGPTLEHGGSMSTERIGSKCSVLFEPFLKAPSIITGLETWLRRYTTAALGTSRIFEWQAPHSQSCFDSAMFLIHCSQTSSQP